MDEQKKRNNLIDIVRLLCAVLVVAIHTSPFNSLENTALVDVFVKLNRTAVPMFLLIAGAFFWEKVKQSGITYAKKYFVRIATMYVFWSVLYAACTYPVYYEFPSLLSLIKVFACQLLYYGTFDHLWYFVCVIYCVILSIMLLHYIKAEYILKFAFPFFFATYILLFFAFGQHLSVQAKRILYNMPFFFLGTMAPEKTDKNRVTAIMAVSFVLLLLEWHFYEIAYYPFLLYVFLLYLFKYLSINEKLGQHMNSVGHYAQITSSIMYTSQFLIILPLGKIISFDRGNLIFIITVAVELLLGWLLSRCKLRMLRYII